MSLVGTNVFRAESHIGYYTLVSWDLLIIVISVISTIVKINCADNKLKKKEKKITLHHTGFERKGTACLLHCV